MFLFVSLQDHLSQVTEMRIPEDSGMESSFLLLYRLCDGCIFLVFRIHKFGAADSQTSKVFLRWLLLPASCPQIACNHRAE